MYNITNYHDFEINKDILSSNIACTVLKVQEKKTQKGNSYGIIKFSDLSNTFELFIFSEIFELNREHLVEGNSLMLTLIKNYSDESRSLKRVNVKKIISLKELTNKPFKNITFKFSDVEDIQKLKKLHSKDAETEVKIILEKAGEFQTFRLKDKRKVNNLVLNELNLTKNILVE